MNWDNVEMIRNAQASNKKRFDEEHIAVQEKIEEAIKSEAFNQLAVPRLTELETMIFKMRSELIDYIVAHGLVDGLILDGVLQPVVNGKIVLTKDLIETITEKLGYYKEEDVLRFIEKYLPEHDYVSDDMYVHTDNNFRDEDVIKLDGIEEGAEVNKVIDILFNGISVLDDGTRVATITITPEDIKQWYESNPDTNAFTDKEKAKLAGISDGAEVNRVDDVILNGRSVLDENKKALLTKELIKETYEANPDTNVFTDDEKARLADINSMSVFTGDASAIKDLQSSSSFETECACMIELRAKITMTDASKKTQVRTIDLMGFGAVDSSRYIVGSTMHLMYVNKSADEDGLQTVTICSNTDTRPAIAVVVNRDNFNAVSVSAEYLSFSHGPINHVVDVTDGDGNSLVDGRGYYVPTEPDLSGLVPYAEADKDVNLGANKLTATELTTKAYAIESDSSGARLVFANGADRTNYGMLQSYASDGASWLAACKYDDKLSFIRVKVANPTTDEDAATKWYVDTALTGKYVPYEGAITGIDMNGKPITNVSNVWAKGSIIACTEAALRYDYNVSSSGAKLVAEQLGGIRFEKGTSTELQHVSVGTPTEDNHAATKKYVDEAVAGGGGGGGALVECNAGEEDIRVITLTAKAACAFTAYPTRVAINSDGTVATSDYTQSKSFTLYSGHQIIFTRSATSSSGGKTFRSVNPVSGNGVYLLYTGSSPDTSWKVQYSGVMSSNTEELIFSGGTSSANLSTDGLTGNYTSKYYKFA